MNFYIDKVRSERWGIFHKDTHKRIMICNRAYNADLIANILDADEELETCKTVKFTNK